MGAILFSTAWRFTREVLEYNLNGNFALNGTVHKIQEEEEEETTKDIST